MPDLYAILHTHPNGDVGLYLSLPGPDGEFDPDAPRHRFVTASSEQRALDWLQWQCVWTQQAARYAQDRHVEEFVARKARAEAMKQLSKTASKGE